MDHKKRFLLYIGLGALFILLAGAAYFRMGLKQDQKITLSSDEEVPRISKSPPHLENTATVPPAWTEEENKSMFVHVCGEVKHPGVYRLPEGSRVIEAVEKAGGFKNSAAKDSINLAQQIKDGEKIYIPNKAEASIYKAGEEEKKENTSGDKQKININTGTEEELMMLPGIGKAKAESIILYREEKGGFKNIEELKNIEGIKNKVFDKIKDSVTIS